jgi:hypothetical protein
MIEMLGTYRGRSIVIWLLVLQPAILTVSCSSLCGNRLISETPEPGGSRKLVVFERGCGAATGFVTHVALLEGAERLSNSTVGDVFAADSNHGAAQFMYVYVDWTPRGAIVVTYPANARVYNKVQRIADFPVSYRQQ